MQAGLEYHRLQRGGWWRGWLPVVGAPALAVSVFVALPLVMAVPFTAGLLLTGATARDLADFFTMAEVTPASLAYLNLTLAGGIHLSILVTALLHRLPPGWLASVAGRLRVRWLLTCLGLSCVALFATLLVGLVVPMPDGEAMTAESVNDFTAMTAWFLLVILFLTPLQAAGEEYLFRGYLTQAVGGYLSSVWVSRALAVVVPALLFALAHGAQDPPVFVDRFAFGLVSGVLVIATGGLEAGIAMHVLNNFLAYGLALAFSDMTSALNPTGGSWWSLPTTLTQSLVYLGLVVLVARAKGVATRTPGPSDPVPGRGNGPVLAPPDRAV